ncbi:MAG TPA: hypothetical protein VMV18_05370 [bacterium]|nr:hypothetical protein [bacterium]
MWTWIVAGLACLALARLAGASAVTGRCLSAAKSMPVVRGQGVSSVERELGALDAHGSWSVGEREADGARPVVYRGSNGAEWSWSCRDEESVPSFVAVSGAARELTPERSVE